MPVMKWCMELHCESNNGKNSKGDSYEKYWKKPVCCFFDVFENSGAAGRMDQGKYEILYLFFSGSGCCDRRSNIDLE